MPGLVHREWTALQMLSTKPASHRSRHSLALALVLLATPALADPRIEDCFQGRGEGRLELQVLAMTDSGSDENEGGYFVDANTSVLNSCNGTLRGIADMTGPRTLRLRRKASGSDDTRELTLRYSPDLARVEMSAQGCSYFRGAACDFAGNLRRR